MSVTFSAAMAPIVGFDLECACGARYLEAGQEPMPYETAAATLVLLKEQKTGLEGCTDDDCMYYGLWTRAVGESEDGPDVNMANGNAVAVMEALGIKTDADTFEDVCCGGLDALDFMGRVLMALAVAPVSAERLTESVQEEGHARVVMCGVGEGYVQEKLEQLRAVAQFAIDEGREVVWS